MKAKFLLVAALVLGLAVANAQNPTPSADSKHKKEHAEKAKKDSTAKAEKKAAKSEKKAEKKPATK
ncbi:hypothetical protein QTN47_27030 [Danxiaibacter flavus]|uniref:Uncharacterized protein n=1 Tax=Danxiaibacter flavus TaxID=3049108 RepID=A0ABV3ZMX6_9BACT|nr:hypothetical protein QNM32_27030 [Chitinophagaceae bacterium DXS]